MFFSLVLANTTSVALSTAHKSHGKAMTVSLALVSLASSPATTEFLLLHLLLLADQHCQCLVRVWAAAPFTVLTAQCLMAYDAKSLYKLATSLTPTGLFSSKASGQVFVQLFKLGCSSSSFLS